MAAWKAGALFIPALALMLGAASHPRMFQTIYVILWHPAVNQVKAADYMGTVRLNGHPAGPPPLLIAGLATAMLTPHVRHPLGSTHKKVVASGTHGPRSRLLGA